MFKIHLTGWDGRSEDSIAADSSPPVLRTALIVSCQCSDLRVALYWVAETWASTTAYLLPSRPCWRP